MTDPVIPSPAPPAVPDAVLAELLRLSAAATPPMYLPLGIHTGLQLIGPQVDFWDACLTNLPALVAELAARRAADGSNP